MGQPTQTQPLIFLKESETLKGLFLFLSHAAPPLQSPQPSHHHATTPPSAGLPATPIVVDDKSPDSNYIRASTQGRCHRQQQSELESSLAATSLAQFLSSSRGANAGIKVAAHFCSIV